MDSLFFFCLAAYVPEKSGFSTAKRPITKQMGSIGRVLDDFDIGAP
jgi:hypothetical protein